MAGGKQGTQQAVGTRRGTVMQQQPCRLDVGGRRVPRVWPQGAVGRAENRETLLGAAGQPRRRRPPGLAERTCLAILRQQRSRRASCDS